MLLFCPARALLVKNTNNGGTITFLYFCNIMRLFRNIWWLTFASTFFIGFILVAWYSYLQNGYLTFEGIELSDWLNYFAASGTVGGFLYLLLDKLLSEKEENHLKWQSEIPFVTLASPCDPSLNYCDINILYNGAVWEGRGNVYFSICNLSKVNAYDISILFSTDEKYTNPSIFNRHYINHLCPLQVFNGTYGPEYAFKESIYSNYNIDPETKKVNNSRFDICQCVNNCNLVSTSASEKYFFVRFIYYSSFAKKSRYQITSDFQVHVICGTETILQPNNQQETRNTIQIKGITQTNYEYKFQSE